MLFTGQADVKPSFNKEAGYNQWPKFPCLIFLLYYHSSTFLNILAVPNNVVFCAAHKSILISILSTYFSKFFETLPRGRYHVKLIKVPKSLNLFWNSDTFQSSPFPSLLFSCAQVLRHLQLLLSFPFYWE